MNIITIYRRMATCWYTIRIGPALGIDGRGYCVRFTKNWYSEEALDLAKKLRTVLNMHGYRHDFLMRTRSCGHCWNERPNFFFIDLRANDRDTAELERQALIGDMEAAKLPIVVDDPEPKRRSKPHPYR